MSFGPLNNVQTMRNGSDIELAFSRSAEKFYARQAARVSLFPEECLRFRLNYCDDSGRVARAFFCNRLSTAEKKKKNIVHDTNATFDKFSFC